MEAILALCIVVALSIWLLWSRRSRARLPPGPLALPVIGTMYLDLFKQKPILERLRNANKKYGDVMMLQHGIYPVITVFHYKLVHELLVKRASIFSNRPPWFTFIANCKGIVWNPDRWPEMRRFAHAAIRDFSQGKDGQEERVITEIGFLTNAFASKNGVAFDPHHILTNAVSNIISAVVFGDRYDYGDPACKKLLQGVFGHFRNSPFRNPINYIPALRYIGTKLGIINQRTQSDDYMLVKDFINAEVERHYESHDPDQPRDLIDMYITIESGHEKSFGSMDRDDMMRVTIDLYLAGTETTSTTIQWFLAYLINYPDVQDRCRKEIHEVIGTSREPRMSDKPNLVFTDATILEVQRLSNIATATLPHTADKDTTLGGYFIPKGAMIFANLSEINMDADAWGPDPRDFRPARWLDEEGNLKKYKEFTPYGLGKRSCLGEQVARIELFLFCTALVQKFKFTSSSGKPPTLVAHWGFTLAPQPFDIIATPVS